MSDDLLSITEVAALLRLSTRSVQRYVSAGILPCMRIAGTPIFSRHALSHALGARPEELREGALVLPGEAGARPGAEAMQEKLHSGELKVIQIGSQKRLLKTSCKRTA